MYFYGIDIHYNSIYVARMTLTDKNPEYIGEIDLCDEKAMKQFMDSLCKDDYVAIEASTNTFWFYDQVKDHVQECYVINPGKFNDISNSKKKTDKIDARKIAKKLRYKVLYDADEEEFPTVYVPQPEVRELRSLHTTKELLTKQCVAIKNRIYSLYVFTTGRDIRQEVDLFNKNMREALINIGKTDAIRVQLKVLYAELDMIEVELDKLKTAILEAGRIFINEIDLLVGISGISVSGAIGIMSDIADINRFDSPKKLCSYLRSAPTVESSNKSTKIGKVNKKSRKLTLKILLQGLHHIYRSSKYLSDFRNRKKKGKSNGKVRVAISRRIIAGIYHMLKNKTNFYWMDEKGHTRKMKEYKNFLKKIEKRA